MIFPARITDVIVVPPRLYELFSRSRVEAEAMCPNDQVLVIDKEGHVHVLHYGGRIIDQIEMEASE